MELLKVKEVKYHKKVKPRIILVKKSKARRMFLRNKRLIKINHPKTKI